MRIAGILLSVLVTGCASPSLRIVVTGGVHGDEPSGAAALPALREKGFVTFGPCNPWGLERQRRELEDGRDLNRLFADGRVAEVRKVRDFLRENPPDLAMDLHESDGEGPYLIQIGPEDGLASEIVAALANEYSFDPAPKWGPLTGKNGVLRPVAQALALQEISKIWSLSFYCWKIFKVTSITVECPTSWPMEKRIAYHVRVAQAAREIMWARSR